MAGDPILIIDDNLMNLKLERVLLEGEGCEIRTAMDGLELTRVLKADPRTHDTTIVALTAYAMKGDEEKPAVQALTATLPSQLTPAPSPLWCESIWDPKKLLSPGLQEVTPTTFSPNCGTIFWRTAKK